MEVRYSIGQKEACWSYKNKGKLGAILVSLRYIMSISLHKY